MKPTGPKGETFGGDLFARAIDADGLLGDVLAEPDAAPDPKAEAAREAELQSRWANIPEED